MTTIMSRDGTRLISGIESAEQRLTDALAIRRGSYPWSRDYGSRLADLVDRTVDSDAEARIFAAVAEAVAHPPNGLADVALREVRLHRLPDHPDRIEIEVVADWQDASGQITPIGIRHQLAGAPARSIWDVPTGHTSHVYVRGAMSVRRRGAHRASSLLDGTIPVPSVMIDEGQAATLAYISVETRERPMRTPAIRMALSGSAGSWRDPGPHISPAWLPHLAVAIRSTAGGAFAARFSEVMSSFSPPASKFNISTEPYFWYLPAALYQTVTDWIAAISEIGEDITIALLYAGPGSVVDLASLTTTELGAAPRIE